MDTIFFFDESLKFILNNKKIKKKNIHKFLIFLEIENFIKTNINKDNDISPKTINHHLSGGNSINLLKRSRIITNHIINKNYKTILDISPWHLNYSFIISKILTDRKFIISDRSRDNLINFFFLFNDKPKNIIYNQNNLDEEMFLKKSIFQKKINLILDHENIIDKKYQIFIKKIINSTSDNFTIIISPSKKKLIFLKEILFNYNLKIINYFVNKMMIINATKK